MKKQQTEFYESLGYRRVDNRYFAAERNGIGEPYVYKDITDISKPLSVGDASYLDLSIRKQPCLNPKYFEYVITESVSGMAIAWGKTRKAAKEHLLRRFERVTKGDIMRILAGYKQISPSFEFISADK